MNVRVATSVIVACVLLSGTAALAVDCPGPPAADADEQTIPKGRGQENGGPCISAGPDGVLDSTAAGNDAVSGSTINAGKDGICESTAADDDIQVRAVGEGAVADALVIAAFTNGVCDLASAAGDDVFVNAPPICVTAGPDGIADTTLCGNSRCDSPVWVRDHQPDGEACDDGNTDNGDLCASDCKVEILPVLSTKAGKMQISLVPAFSQCVGVSCCTPQARSIFRFSSGTVKVYGPKKLSGDAASAKMQMRGVVNNVDAPVTNIIGDASPDWRLRMTFRRTTTTDFSAFRCFGGPNQGEICTVDSECPSGLGCVGQGTSADEVIQPVIEVVEGTIKTRVEFNVAGSAELVKLEVIDEEGNTLAAPGLP